MATNKWEGKVRPFGKKYHQVTIPQSLAAKLGLAYGQICEFTIKTVQTQPEQPKAQEVEEKEVENNATTGPENDQPAA